MKKIAVILAGCGVYDGSEVNEVVLSLLSIEQQGAQYQCFAPDIEQMHVVNHLTGAVSENERRNVLVEAARIARGHIKAISELRVEEFDGMIIPGGFGAAKNLSDFAVTGAQMKVQEDLLGLARAMHRAKKPIGLICIAPTMAAAICGAQVKCTIGNDEETAAAINHMGAEHIDCAVDSSVVDSKNKLVTTPAYMLTGKINDAYKGIQHCINNLLAMC